MEHNTFRRCSHLFFEISGDKYGTRGSIFGNMIGRSKNVLKHIAIDQESLISHSGIIKAPQKTQNHNNTTRENKTSFFCFVVFCGPYLKV